MTSAIHDLEARISAAERAHARAQGERDAAAADADRGRKQLHEEFGVSTLDEAVTLLADLETQLATATKALRDQLDAMGV